MSEEKLNNLLNRTAKFHRSAASKIANFSLLPEDRCVTSYKAASLSFEHALSAHLLISNGLYPSGFSLYRPQFESAVRGIWLLHAASDEWVNKLSGKLLPATANKANEGLMVAEMLKQLEESSAPKPLVAQLKEYREFNWKILSSYAHGGIHPLTRTVEGYPAELAYGAILNSNALVAITTQLSAILTGDKKNMEPVRSLHQEFEDCIPLI